MKTISTHIKQIRKTVEDWLDSDHAGLQEAIRKTVEAGLFSREDIEFQLSVLRENIKNNDLEAWAKQASLSDTHNAMGAKVLCLHAGNLPLVGFQTALGAILSGADYYGKLSRKDPYLLGSFLKEVQHRVESQEVYFSTDLNSFQNLQADKVVFAGSEASVPEVKKEILNLNAAKSDAEYIIRTAKFSMAYVENWNEETKEALVEGMLRYGGKGCRSVAVVIAPISLDEVREELEGAIQAFWKDHPLHLNPTPDLTYQYAYNKGIEREQLWLQDVLVQEAEELPEIDFTVNWVKGDPEKVRDLQLQYGGKVQSVYTMGETIKDIETEPLNQAQRPPLYWKPDGVDVISALIL